MIADDHALLLDGLSRLLSSEFEIVGTAANGRTLIQSALHLRPDLIVLDIGMPERNGIEAARQLSTQLPSTFLVVVTQQLAPDYLRAAFQAGVRACVAKQSPPPSSFSPSTPFSAAASTSLPSSPHQRSKAA